MTVMTCARYSLVFLWLFTAGVSLTWGRDLGYQVLAGAGITGAMANLCVYGGALLDLFLGLWLLSGRQQKFCCQVQIAIIVIYTVLLTLIDSSYWLHPFGALTKNIPILCLLFIIQQGTSKPA